MFFSYFSCFDQNKSCNNLMLLCILYVAGKYNSCCFLTFFSLTKTTAATIRCYAGAGYENTLSACKFQFFLQKKYLCYTSCFIVLYICVIMKPLKAETVSKENSHSSIMRFESSVFFSAVLLCLTAMAHGRTVENRQWSNE